MTPDEGDWVRTTRTEHTGVMDALTGPGLPPGTRCVVIARQGSQVTVRADDGFGGTEVTVPAHRLRITDRRRGVQAFDRRVSWRLMIRFGAILALTIPVLVFVIQYVWSYRTLNGIIEAFALGLVDSSFAQFDELIHDPVRAVIVIVIGALTARLAFGPRRKKKP